MSDKARPGSAGEHILQEEYGTSERANLFYDNQVLDNLNERMRGFIAAMEMMFVSTADAHGDCDCSIRCGEAGFVAVLSDRRLMYPEFRGNGVMASLGNLRENGHVGLLFVDFFKDCVGLHVNGRARVAEVGEVVAFANLPDSVREMSELRGGRRPERWVIVDIDEAYIHCSKHLPLLAKREKKIHWGTDDPRAKGGDYFAVKFEAEQAADRAD